MAELIVPKLGVVQETMLVPLYARAKEQILPSPIVLDPHAVRIMNSIDYDFESISRFSNSLVGCCVRASVFDGWILTFLAGGEDTVVVEIGAGLDTTFDRNDDGKVMWYELDLPDAIEIRSQFISESDRRKFIFGSVLDPAWVAKVKETGRSKFLFQLAGVLMYFKEEQVKQILALIANEFPGAIVLFDACAKWAWKNSDKWEATVQLTQAEYRWGITKPRHLAKWDPRLQVQDTKYLLQMNEDRWDDQTRFWTRWWPPVSRGFSLNRMKIDDSSAH